MRKDGKALQDLAAFVERTLHPLGYDVVTNRLEYDAKGNLLAEFDIQFIGTHQNSGYKWLIECRDRPSDGKAPGSWIEQLVGRRSRFGFNKVTAVSSTGFAPGATDYAIAEDIEIKEVASMRPEDFGLWLATDHVAVLQKNYIITNVGFKAGAVEPQLLNALNHVLNENATKGGQAAALFRGVVSGEHRSLNDMFFQATNQFDDWKDLIPNEPRKTVELAVNLGGFCIDTSAGAVEMISVSFRGDIWVTETKVPIKEHSQYQKTGGEGFISQSAQAIDDDGEKQRIFEFHHIPESGFTHVVVHEKPSIKKTK
jgi:hypothetical protein